jgi:hypothetical protein
MTSKPSERPRVDWWGTAALRLHTILVVGLAGAGAAAWFEWTRALSGHQLAWAYSFEWPLFGLVGIHIWWRLLHQEATRSSPASSALRPTQPRSGTVVADDDPDLVAWEAYLQRLHAVDPPGGPPAARYPA